MAIILVIGSHFDSTSSFPMALGKYFLLFFDGNLGVRIFFVVSGFLIILILLQEADRTGTISLRRFYMRRVFRIFPIYFAYLAVLLVLTEVVPIR